MSSPNCALCEDITRSPRQSRQEICSCTGLCTMHNLGQHLGYWTGTRRGTDVLCGWAQASWILDLKWKNSVGDELSRCVEWKWRADLSLFLRLRIRRLLRRYGMNAIQYAVRCLSSSMIPGTGCSTPVIFLSWEITFLHLKRTNQPFQHPDREKTHLLSPPDTAHHSNAET